MPINKFTTLLDLARQAKILTGETATFDGKIEVGIPFSGFSTGVNTATTVSLGVISSENAVFSGNTGTTIFDVSNILSPNYNVLFSGYSATTWTNPLFSGTTSGLTLPITIFSANTQIIGPYWSLTQTGMTGDYVIDTQYTGYSITYSFFNVADISTTATTLYSGFTTATQENFSAGTLDYKGPLDYLSTKEDATVDGRLTTNKITITNGASLGTIGYVLTQVGLDGDAEWQVSSSGSTFTGNTSATCITDLYITNLYGCSPITVHDNLQHSGSTASGLFSIAFGGSNLASGIYSFAIGSSVSATTAISTAFGLNTLSSGLASFAEGSETVASGAQSHAQNKSTIASGIGSNAQGTTTVASGDFSHAQGSTTVASGDNSHSQGSGTVASGTNSYSQGSGTIASGDNSHGGGVGSIASGSTAFTHFTITGGTNTGVYGDYSAILGRNLNIIDTNVKRSVILGGEGITGTTNDTVFVPNLNINTSFTPSGMGDTTGSIGNITWDNIYLYVKTNDGWGRITLDYGF
jgi:hypothetical protein